MRCGACEGDNPEGKRFCGECGVPLAAACPACGSAVEEGRRFCGDCGAPLAAAATASRAGSPTAAFDGGGVSEPAPVAERRVCSVLFCDLVGFTPLSESRDPEAVREILARYFEESRTVIQRYGGVVEKFIGDAVMAVWGTPVAREGDAERAVRAALDLLTRVSELGQEIGATGLAARVGIVSGEVAVTIGAVGQGMVAGDAVNTAARVQSAAEGGTVLVDDGTWRAARGSVAFSDAGEHALKGKTEPQRLWRVDRIVSGTGGSQRIDGLEARMVGRDAELRLVKELFHACADRKSARLVSVVGAAGVGKSRLGWEFEKYVDGLASFVAWHHGRCLSYGDGVAFWALTEMVRQRLEIAEEDPTSVARRKLDAGLDRYVTDPAARGYVRPRLARLLGLAEDEEPLSREELFAGWRLFFEKLAETDPVVLIIEDLHHGDAGLFDFIEHLLDWVHDAPIFVLTFARPEIEERRPGWGGARRNATGMTLEPLDSASMQAMLDDLVTGMPVAAESAIAARAEGIPLYAVETVRMLVDRDIVQPIDGVYRLVGDVGQLTVPDSLQSLLAARLDSLEPDARRLVADAAVLGGTFPAEALAAVSGLPEAETRRLLAELVRKEVLAVRADPLSPQRGHYGFTQMLFRQVAYDTLSRRERKARHLRVADHLTRTFPGDGEEIAEVVAEHMLDALMAVPDDLDVEALRVRACELLDRAGTRALTKGAPGTAAESFSRAADLEADGDADRQAAWREAAGSARALAGDYALAMTDFERVLDLHRSSGRERDVARVQLEIATVQLRLGRMSDCLQTLEAALTVLSGVPDELQVRALCAMARVKSFTGRDRFGAGDVARGFEIAEAERLAAPLFVELFNAEAAVYRAAGQYRRSAGSFREALGQALESADPLTAHILANLSDVLGKLDPASAVEPARQAATLARRIGSSFMLAMALGNLAESLVLTGRWEEADEIFAEAERDGLQQAPYCIWPLGPLGFLRRQIQAVDEAGATFEALRESQDPQDLLNMALQEILGAAVRDEHSAALSRTFEALGLVGNTDVSSECIRWAIPVALDAAFAVDDHQGVERLIAWVEGFPRGHHIPLTWAAAQLAQARLATIRSDPTAGPAYDAAVAGFRDYGSPWHLGDALLRRAEGRRASGDVAGADADAAEALDIAGRLDCQPLFRRAMELSGDRQAVTS